MRFTGERHVAAPVPEVWDALHAREVLQAAIPGCERLVPTGSSSYGATLAVRVGPVADTYRGEFTITDLTPSTLRVGVEGRGRCGRLELDLLVSLAGGAATTLSYDASAVVRGFVARVGAPALTVAGATLTACFFRDLDRAMAARFVGVPA